MSTRVATDSWIPPLGWWVLLIVVFTVGLVGDWFVAAGLLAAVLVYTARPFDVVVAYLIATCGATFIYYAGGQLTLQIGLLTAALVLMLIFYVITCRGETFNLPVTGLTTPLVIYVLMSMAQAARGVLMGYAIKDILIEVAPVLGLASALVVGNVFNGKRDLPLVVSVLVGLAYASAAMGYYIFSLIHTHTAGIYFHAVPGVVALLMLNLALRSRNLVIALGWLALSLPLYLHQFLSFRRGLWLGLIAGILTSVLIFALGPGARPRWQRVGFLLGSLVGTAIVGAVALAIIYGQSDILSEAGGRFASIGETKVSRETMSNITRLIEYWTVVGLVKQSPWIGHGLGYSFLVRNVVNAKTEVQWWVHENYLLVWLKQGVIGLVVFVWMLWSAFRLGVHHARRRLDPWEASWLATAAATTAFMAAFSIADYPFDLVEAIFLVALVWGGAMGIVREGFLRIRWKPPLPGGERRLVTPTTG